MRYSRFVLLLIIVAGLGLLLVFLPPLIDSPTSSVAAPMLDTYEPNDLWKDAYGVNIPAVIDAEISPITDTDYFSLPTQTGITYRLYLAVHNSAANLRVQAFDNNQGVRASTTTTSTASLEWISYAPTHWIQVVQTNTGINPVSYRLEIYQVAATPTPTNTPVPTNTPTPSPTPTSTPVPPTPVQGADQYEPNYDFDHATIIATDITYDLNLIPWSGFNEDNDFFKLWVKPGIFFTCETFDLDPGVDTNMIMFNGPSWDNQVGGNDDKDPLDYGSRVSYYATYEGWLYVLVGTGDRQPPPGQGQSDYSLSCERNMPGVPTLTPSPRPTSTPHPNATPTAPPPPPSTPTTASGDLAVRRLAAPTPPPPPASPTLHFVPVDFVVYYDANNDHEPGAGEGVAGLLVLAYDTATGEQIAQGFTDDLGHLQFTAAAQGAVRLSVPFLGVSQLIGSEGATTYIRIAPPVAP